MGIDPASPPQGRVIVFDDLAVEFLAPKARAQIARAHRVEKSRREIAGVRLRRTARDDDIGRCQQRLDAGNRARRRGDRHARIGAEAKAHQRHVERRLRFGPLGEFVKPESVELRTAQAVRLIGREHADNRAGRKGEAPVGRLIGHILAELQQTGFAFDHHGAGIVMRRADEADAAHVPGPDVAREPVRAGERLARAATAQEEPDSPGAFRGMLFVAQPETPAFLKFPRLILCQTGKQCAPGAHG